MEHVLNPSQTPELVIGLVAPIGVDLDNVTDILTELLREMDYTTRLFRVTSLMTEIPTKVSLHANSFVNTHGTGRS